MEIGRIGRIDVRHGYGERDCEEYGFLVECNEEGQEIVVETGEFVGNVSMRETSCVEYFEYEKDDESSYKEALGKAYEALEEALDPNTFYYKNKENIALVVGCKNNATEIEIPDEIDGYPVTRIGENAFYGCSELTSITIPNSVTKIGEYAFCECESLKKVTLSEKLFNENKEVFEQLKDCKFIFS